jgi:hypothetical protein
VILFLASRGPDPIVCYVLFHARSTPNSLVQMETRTVLIVCRVLCFAIGTLMCMISAKLTMSSATVFLGYLRGNWRYLRFSLISAVDFYYVINKLIMLVPDIY